MDDPRRTVEALLRAPPKDAAAVVRSLGVERVLDFVENWGGWAHRGQLAPGGDWRTWVLMAGRGFGKTRAGAEWVLAAVRGEESPSPLGEGPGVGAVARSRRGHMPHPNPSPEGEGLSDLRVALVAATVDEARRVMVEGASGILACARPGEILEWSRSRGEVVFAGGARATLFSGANPEALRGPQHHFAWCDELAKWRHAEAAWDMLQLGLRCGERPQTLVTTTPSGGCAALKRILADVGKGTALSGGPSGANPHLPAASSALSRALTAARGWGARRSTGCSSPTSRDRYGRGS